MTMVDPPRAGPFVPVPCRCGRLLRAKLDMIGAEIQCWDCRQMVVVPYPRQHGQGTRALARGLWNVTRVETLAKILGATALVILAMMIPRLGLVAAGVALAAVSVMLLGRAVERASLGGIAVEPVGWRGMGPASAVRVALAALVAAGTVIPLWAMHAGPRHSPRWDPAGLALFAVAWVVFPIASLMAFGRDRRGRLGVREGLRVIAHHPLMVLLALAIVPVSVVLSEVLLVVMTLWEGAFSFLALDLFPIPGNPEIIGGVPMYNNVDFRSYPTNRFFQGYWDALGQGYSFAGALPASLSLPTTHDLNSHAIYVRPVVYRACRALGSGLVVAMILGAATLQAYWLGALAAVDHGRVDS